MLCLPNFLFKLSIFDVKENISGIEYLSFNKSFSTRNIVFNDLLKSPLFDGKKFSKEFLGSLEAIYNK